MNFSGLPINTPPPHQEPSKPQETLGMSGEGRGSMDAKMPIGYCAYFFAGWIALAIGICTVIFWNLTHRVSMAEAMPPIEVSPTISVIPTKRLPIAHSSKKGIQEKIVAAAVKHYTETGEFVDISDALRIANCESGFKWDAASKVSSAKGVYQFLDGTWKHIGAKGHQFDEDENIRQFMIHYPSNPGMWECK